MSSDNHYKKKSIHVFTHTFYPVAAGTETNILETYSVLAKKDWNVTIHTSQNTLTEKNILPEEEIVRGIQVYRYNTSSYFGFFPNKLDWKKSDIIVVHNLDIIPHVYIFLNVWLIKLFGRKKFKFFFVPHGNFPPDAKGSGSLLLKSFLRRIFYQTIGYLLIKWTVDGIRVISEWEKEKLISIGIKPALLRVIPNGIEAEAFKNIDQLASKNIKKQVQELGDYIIQIGRISQVKNCETAIKALHFLPSNIKLMLIGPVDKQKYYEYLCRLINQLKLNDRVVFTGTVRGIDKYYLLKKALILVHMSVWESFCNVVHEAMSQGLVCIVSNKTALPYLIKEGVNGFCLNPYDVKGLVEKINYVIENKHSEKIKAMEERNRKFALNHPWTKTAQGMDLFYKDLLSLKTQKLSILNTQLLSE